MTKKFCILIWISLKFISKGRIDNKSALVQVMKKKGNGLEPNGRQAITVTWTNADPVHWQIYAALRGDELTHWGLVMPEIWVNIGSGNGLLPDGTKPLPEPMLTYHQ